MTLVCRARSFALEDPREATENEADREPAENTDHQGRRDRREIKVFQGPWGAPDLQAKKELRAMKGQEENLEVLSQHLLLWCLRDLSW